MRKIEFGSGVVVVPYSLVNNAEREVDAGKTTVFVVYPDGTTGSELADILATIKELEELRG